MTRKRLFLVLAALAALAVAGTAAVLWPRPRVTKESYECVKLGMTRREVESIVGVPPGDYTGGPMRPTDDEYAEDIRGDVVESWHRLGDGKISLLLPSERWEGDAGCLGVGFDPAGRAFSKYFIPREREEQSPLDNLLWQLKRAWKRLAP
jgi:hypothetical protein